MIVGKLWFLHLISFEKSYTANTRIFFVMNLNFVGRYRALAKHLLTPSLNWTGIRLLLTLVMVHHWLMSQFIWRIEPLLNAKWVKFDKCIDRYIGDEVMHHLNCYVPTFYKGLLFETLHRIPNEGNKINSSIPHVNVTTSPLSCSRFSLSMAPVEKKRRWYVSFLSFHNMP